MGVYCGWASVNKKEVHKMIVNIGSHPIYGHMRKTMVGTCTFDKLIATSFFFFSFFPKISRVRRPFYLMHITEL